LRIDEPLNLEVTPASVKAVVIGIPTAIGYYLRSADGITQLIL